MSKKGIIIIPSYNEARSLHELLTEYKTLQGVLDLVIIDDGSNDNTPDYIKKFQDQRIRVVSHKVNLGYARALQTGMKYALDHKYSFCVIMDADGQHRFNDVSSIINSWKACQKDFILGSRFLSEETCYSQTFLRRFMNRFFNILTSWIIRASVTDSTSGFKLLTKNAMNACQNIELNDFHADLIVYLYLKEISFQEHPISCKQREQGASMYNVFEAMAYPLKTMLSIFKSLLIGIKINH